MKRNIVAVSVVLLGLAIGFAHAQNSYDGAARLKISAGGRDLYKLAIPLLQGDAANAKLAQDVASNDLSLAGYFKTVDPAAFLANLNVEGLGINPTDWKNVGAEGVIKGRATAYGGEVKFEFRLYEVAKGSEPVLSREYRGPTAAARMLVHQWDNEVTKYYTGEDGFFTSRIAFSSATGGKRREIFVMDWDGANIASISNNRSQNILPSWGRARNEILYTSFIKGKPDLYAINAGGGTSRMISARAGMNMGGSFSPDGAMVATTLSQDGNAEIYELAANSGAIIKRMTNTPFIDTSPTWSPDGSRIAFVSDRYGSPQLWLMGADGSGQTKLTRKGTYNQTPAWTPRTDVPLIAFTARDEKLSYDIFTINADTGELKRVTEGVGSNQKPTWSPNGRAIAYESSRGGIWVSTADGRVERQVYRGNASSPTWGPMLKPFK